MGHEHKNCRHKKIRYCSVCDVVHCKKCGREWGKWRGYNYYPWTPNTFYTTSSHKHEDGSTIADDNTTGTVYPYEHSVTVNGG